MDLLNKSVGQIVLEQPETSATFEKLGIDYCCGGKQSLAMACERAGVATSQVVEALARTPTPTTKAPPTDTLGHLIQHLLETHHVYTRAALETLRPLMAKVLRVHGDKHPELAKVAELVAGLEDDLLPHLMKEERVLFPYILALEVGGQARAPFGTVAAPIGVMNSEHEAVGDLLRSLRATTGGYQPPEGACTSYRALYSQLQAFEADLHQHIHLENNALFPRALELEATRRGLV